MKKNVIILYDIVIHNCKLFKLKETEYNKISYKKKKKKNIEGLSYKANYFPSSSQPPVLDWEGMYGSYPTAAYKNDYKYLNILSI